MKLKNIHSEMQIRTTPKKMWEVLSQFGDVSRFHAGVAESHHLPGSDNTASLGCERICNIVDMGMKIMLKERIVDFVEGQSYRYEVYEWKNFPIQKMFFSFTILPNSATHTILALDIDYRAKPAVLTPLLTGKMRSLTRDILLGYKHYTETGQLRVPVRQLKQQFAQKNSSEMQYG